MPKVHHLTASDQTSDCFAHVGLMSLRIMSIFTFSLHLNTSVGHDRHGRLTKGVFYQHSASGLCLIPEMLCNLEPMLSNTSLATDTVVYGPRRLS